MEKSKNKCKVEQLHSSACKDWKPVSLNKNKQFVSTLSSPPPVGLPGWESCKKANGGIFVCLIKKQGWGAQNKRPSESYVMIHSAGCEAVPPGAGVGTPAGSSGLGAVSARQDIEETGQDIAGFPAQSPEQNLSTVVMLLTFLSFVPSSTSWNVLWEAL